LYLIVLKYYSATLAQQRTRLAVMLGALALHYRWLELALAAVILLLQFFTMWKKDSVAVGFLTARPSNLHFCVIVVILTLR